MATEEKMRDLHDQHAALRGTPEEAQQKQANIDQLLQQQRTRHPPRNTPQTQ